MKILGITAPISENTSACIVVDGELIAFAEEERFVGIKHAPKMIPYNAIEFCLQKAYLSIDEIDIIAVGFENVFCGWIKNILTNLKERNISRGIKENGAFLEYFVNSFRLRSYFEKLQDNSKSSNNISKKFIFIPHHEAHAASTAYCSGFDESIVISLDGVGENNAGLLGFYRDNKVVKLKTIGINQSLGWFYGIVTKICGFKMHSHEGKLMGLAAYGKPDMFLLKNIAELTENGYLLQRNWVKKIEKKFKIRKPNEEITQKYKDLADTAQYFLEQAFINLTTDLHKKTGLNNVCLAGGVALNCDGNAKIIGLDFVDNIFIQPAANDAGTSLGAALEVYRKNTGKMIKPLLHPYYGPEYSNEDIESLLIESKIEYKRLNSIKEIAEKIYQGKIIGWFNGRIEFGPRALGGRSILANPKLPYMKDKINKEVKHRESWRPFSPSILEDHADDYLENFYSSPFMLLTFQVKKEKKDDLIAAIHVDNSARVQSVSKETNPRYYELINEFYKLSGVPAVLNTSFNDKDKPICLTPRDALQTFYSTGIDVLVLEDFVIEK